MGHTVTVHCTIIESQWHHYFKQFSAFKKRIDSQSVTQVQRGSKKSLIDQ